EHLAQPEGVRAQCRERGGGRALAPYGVEEFRRGGRTPTAQQQRGEQGALLWCAGADRLVTAPGTYRAEDREPQTAARLRPGVHLCPQMRPRGGHPVPRLSARISIVHRWTEQLSVWRVEPGVRPCPCQFAVSGRRGHPGPGSDPA